MLSLHPYSIKFLSGLHACIFLFLLDFCSCSHFLTGSCFILQVQWQYKSGSYYFSIGLSVGKFDKRNFLEQSLGILNKYLLQGLFILKNEPFSRIIIRNVEILRCFLGLQCNALRFKVLYRCFRKHRELAYQRSARRSTKQKILGQNFCKFPLY